MKKYVLCISMILIGCQLQGMAGLRGYGNQISRYLAQKLSNTQMPYAAINRYTQSLRQTTRLYTPKPTSPNEQTSYWAAIKNAFSTMQRQAATTWSRHRTPITLSTLGLSGTGLAYRDDSIQNILGAQAVSAEEVMRERFSFEQLLDYLEELKGLYAYNDKEKRIIERRIEEQLDYYLKQLEYGHLDDEEKSEVESSFDCLALSYKNLSISQANRDYLAKLLCRMKNITLNEQRPIAKMLKILRQSSIRGHIGQSTVRARREIESHPASELISFLTEDVIGLINTAPFGVIYHKGYFFIPKYAVNLLIEISKDQELKEKVDEKILEKARDLNEYISSSKAPQRDPITWLQNEKGKLFILNAIQEIIDGKYSPTQEDYIIYRISSGGW